MAGDEARRGRRLALVMLAIDVLAVVAAIVVLLFGWKMGIVRPVVRLHLVAVANRDRRMPWRLWALDLLVSVIVLALLIALGVWAVSHFHFPE